MHDYMAILRGIISQLAGVLWLSPFKTTKSHPEYHMVSFISYYMLYIYIYICVYYVYIPVYPMIPIILQGIPLYPAISYHISHGISISSVEISGPLNGGTLPDKARIFTENWP